MANGRPGWIDEKRLAGVDGEPGQWLATGHDARGTYHSPLKSINASNAGGLGFAWQAQLGTYRGLEATPVVVDGVMFASGNFGMVYALDAATGRQLWRYDPVVDGQYARYACCDAVNRGIVVWKGVVYVASLDGYLHAVDAATGKRLWKADTLPARGAAAPYTITGAPVVTGKMIVIGAGGGDFRGVRGYVAAFDIETGALRWRFYTVPRNPALGPQDQRHLVDAVKTWDARHEWGIGGGGTVWDGISYDAATNLVFVGVGNASPYDIKMNGRTGGDDLFTSSIVAIHAVNGTLAWHYQTVPGDMWDFDSTQKMVLAELPVGGRQRAVIMQASKNGFFYVLDRQTGELISASAYAFANWTKGIDMKTGRPIPNPAVDYAASPRMIFPWEGGAHSWQPMSFDPETHRAFIPVMEVGDIQLESAKLPAGLVEGEFSSPFFVAEDYDRKSLASLFGELPSIGDLGRGLPPPNGRGFLRAWDAVGQKLVWEVPTHGYWVAGVLSTGGDLVFQGDIAGFMNVYAAGTGKLLKRVELGTSVMAAPMTYSVAGTQYVAVMAGYGGGQLAELFPADSAAYRYGNAGRIIALKLGGGGVPLPAPVEDEALARPGWPRGTVDQAAHGEVLYNRFCSRCHAFGRSVLPDLRRLSRGTHEAFDDILLNGLLSSAGMGRFDDVLSRGDAEAIHAFIVDQATNAVAPP